MAKQELWALVYTHRHGVDISAYETEALAERSAAELCAREASDECTAEIALQVQGFYNLGHYPEAIQLYVDHVHSESFETMKVTVDHGVIRGSTVVEHDNEIVHMVKTFPNGSQMPGDAWCGRMFFWVNSSVTLPVNTSGFKAFLPKEPRFTTCLSCIGSADGE